MAAGIGAIGVLALTRTAELREVPLAAMPFIFALQQSIEGLLWLNLPSAPNGVVSTNLTLTYLLLAEVFWPVFAPLTAVLIEPSISRRRLMLMCLAIGIGVGSYSLWWTLSQPHSATILHGHIVYIAMHGYSDAPSIGYFVATVVALLLSSRRAISLLGIIILASYAISYLFYREALVSVWCYYAAAASLVILGYVEWSRRRRLRGA